MVVVALAAHGIHEYQIQRTAGSLLAKARALRENGEPLKAIGYYERYVQLAPSDMEALAEFGQLLADMPGNASAALDALERVLQREADFPGLRRRVVELAIATGRFDDAKGHLQNYSLIQHPTNGQLWDLLGQCQQATKDPQGATASYRLAIQYKPAGWEAYYRLATLLHSQGQPFDEADRTINAMVENNPDHPEAYYARGRYWSDGGHAAEALADADKLMALNTGNVAHVLFASLAAQAQNELEKAETYAARARALNARDINVYIVSARIALSRSDNDKAAEVLTQGLALLPQQPELLWVLGNLYADSAKWGAVGTTIAELRKASNSQTRSDYLESRMLLHQGDVLGAEARLEQLRKKPDLGIDLRKQVDYWLGICYERAGNLDQQTTAFRHALEQDPTWQAARDGLARSLAAAGRIDEAIDNFRQVLSAPQIPSSGWQDLARLLILQQLRQSHDRRNWRATEEALAKAKQITPNSPQLTILQAEILVAQGRGDQAESMLTEACDSTPDAVDLWTASSALLSSGGKHAEARARLETAKVRMGDLAVIRLASIRETLSLEQDVAQAALVELRQDWDRFSKDEQFALARQTASAYTMLGASKEAESLWFEAIALRPEWMPGYLQLFDSAAARNDQQLLAKLLVEMQRIEGRPRGPQWCYGEALRRFLAAPAGDKTRLTSVRKLLDEAIQQQPRWPKPFMLMAEVEKLDGKLAAATARYQSALDLGERTPALIQRLVMLLFQLQRFAEADQVLHILEEQQDPFSDDLGRLASQVAWRVEDYARALELAKKVAAESSKVEDYLWLGQLHMLMRQPDQAEQAYRKAVTLDPQEPRGWLVLVQHFVRLKSANAVEQTLLEAGTHLSRESVALARARALELREEPDAAKEEFRRAIALSPNDGQLLASAAEFSIRREDFAQSERLLRDSLRPEVKCTEEERATARRKLALLLARGREYPKVREALSLLGQNETDSTKISDMDRRVRAVLLAASPGLESRSNAIQILEKLVEQSSAQPSDRFLLAQLYQDDGRWPPARRLFQELVVAEDSKPEYMASYIRGLLNHDDLPEAELWLARLQKLQPADSGTVELRVQIEFAAGRIEQAIDTANNHAKKLDSPAGRAWAAGLLDTLAQKSKDSSTSRVLSDAAEAGYRSLAEGNPRYGLEIARLLSRQNRVHEALELCLKPGTTSDARAALIAAVSVASVAGVSVADRQRVEDLLLRHLDEHPDAPSLVIALGTLYESQENWEKAIQTYRRTLVANKLDVTALNNLALILAFRGDAKEAQDLIEQAVRIAGPLTSILDSRGTVRLHLGDFTAAVADYSAAAGDHPTATTWFHLALAQSKAQHHGEATKAYKRALAAGLRRDQLHPLERAEYDQLHSRFEEPPKGGTRQIE